MVCFELSRVGSVTSVGKFVKGVLDFVHGHSGGVGDFLRVSSRMNFGGRRIRSIAAKSSTQGSRDGIAASRQPWAVAICAPLGHGTSASRICGGLEFTFEIVWEWAVTPIVELS